MLMAEMTIDDRYCAVVGRQGRIQALSTAVRHRPGIIC
jgi:hypothetical protein